MKKASISALVVVALLVAVGAGLKGSEAMAGPSDQSNAAVSTDVGRQIVPLVQRGIVSPNRKWWVVKFREHFAKRPVVVAGPVNDVDSAPCVPRIRKVTRKGFKIRLQEWPYQDDFHGRDEVAWMAVEPGAYALPGGGLLVAGDVRTQRTSLKNPRKVNFSQPFGQTPVVLAQVQTFNGARAVTDRICKVRRSSFTVAMQEQEDTKHGHCRERIGYIALNTGVMRLGQWACDIGVTPVAVSNWPYAIQTTKGICKIYIQEERSLDGEMAHRPERVGYVSFGGTPMVVADMQSCNERDTAVVRYATTVLPVDAVCQLSVSAQDEAEQSVAGAVADGVRVCAQGELVTLEAQQSVSDGESVLVFGHWEVDGEAMAAGQLAIEVEMAGDRAAVALYSAAP